MNCKQGYVIAEVCVMAPPPPKELERAGAEGAADIDEDSAPKPSSNSSFAMEPPPSSYSRLSSADSPTEPSRSESEADDGEALPAVALSFLEKMERTWCRWQTVKMRQRRYQQQQQQITLLVILLNQPPPSPPAADIFFLNAFGYITLPPPLAYSSDNRISPLVLIPAVARAFWNEGTGGGERHS